MSGWQENETMTCLLSSNVPYYSFFVELPIATNMQFNELNLSVEKKFDELPTAPPLEVSPGFSQSGLSSGFFF